MKFLRAKKTGNRAAAQPSQHVGEAVNRAMHGDDPALVLLEAIDLSSLPNPLAVRKQIRRLSSQLYNFLSDSGTLHEFALDVASKMDVHQLEKRYEIPKELRHELANVAKAF